MGTHPRRAVVMRRLLNQFWLLIGTALAVLIVSWFIYMPNADERGVWRSQSGAMILTLTPFQATLYSASSASCIKQIAFPAHMKLVEWAEGATIHSHDGNNLTLNIDGTLDPIQFATIAALPDTCKNPNPSVAPTEVFDALWAAMDEHYAFFDLHGVNWDARRALAPTGAPTLTDNDLFALLSQTLDGLDDGHVQLVSPFDDYSPSIAPEWLTDTLTYASLTQAARDAVGADLAPVDLTVIEYTVLPDGVAYVLIRYMDINTPFGAREQAAAATAFAEVARAIDDASAIIIDIRYNPGGSDSVAFGFASHFTEQPIDVFTKTTRVRTSQSAPFTATLMPYDTTPLDQPVILLTSKLTGSASEIFTLAMRELPNVTVMGEATSGGLSDILEFTLPNGWSLGLSNQTYLTMDGTSFEAIGIPPDIAIQTDSAALQLGTDPVLRAAFAEARQP